MWEGYINALADFIVKYELEAEISIDRFHVATHYRDGFDGLRKKEVKRLKETLPEDVFRRDFQSALWILRHNHTTLGDKKKA